MNEFPLDFLGGISDVDGARLDRGGHLASFALREERDGGREGGRRRVSVNAS